MMKILIYKCQLLKLFKLKKSLVYIALVCLVALLVLAIVQLHQMVLGIQIVQVLIVIVLAQVLQVHIIILPIQDHQFLVDRHRLLCLLCQGIILNLNVTSRHLIVLSLKIGIKIVISLTNQNLHNVFHYLLLRLFLDQRL